MTNLRCEPLVATCGQAVSLKIKQPMPSWEEQKIVIGASFLIAATNGIDPARRFHMEGFCQSVEHLFESVQGEVATMGGEVMEQETRLRRCFGIQPLSSVGGMHDRLTTYAVQMWTHGHVPAWRAAASSTLGSVCATAQWRPRATTRTGGRAILMGRSSSTGPPLVRCTRIEYAAEGEQHMRALTVSILTVLQTAACLLYYAGKGFKS
jgi:hypothetical protein